MPCTVRLLVNLATAAYRSNCAYRFGELVAVDKVSPEEQTAFARINKDIQKDGYTIISARSPEGAGSISVEQKKLEKSPLGYVVAVPREEDKESPIVISYRGTKLKEDLRADARLTFMGVVGKSYRDEAYRVYQTIREQFPGREIVLTGHSLGGHLAQYVAVKAMATNHERKISVRTFNSAAAKTKYGEEAPEKTSPDLNALIKRRVLNYRLKHDLVSNVGKHYGPKITIGRVPGARKYSPKPHLLKSVIDNFPAQLLENKVGYDNPLDELREKTFAYITHLIVNQENSGIQLSKSNQQKLTLLKTYLSDILQVIDVTVGDERNEDKINEINRLTEELETGLKARSDEQKLSSKESNTLENIKSFIRPYLTTEPVEENVSDIKEPKKHILRRFIDKLGAAIINFIIKAGKFFFGPNEKPSSDEIRVLPYPAALHIHIQGLRRPPRDTTAAATTAPDPSRDKAATASGSAEPQPTEVSHDGGNRDTQRLR